MSSSGSDCELLTAMDTNMKLPGTARLSTGAAATALLAVSLAAPAPTAAATGGGSYDIVRVASRSVVVSSPSCRNVPVSVTFLNSPWGAETYFSADLEVWHGAAPTGSFFIYDTVSGWSGVPTLSGDYYYCPYEGLGTFRVGPSHVDANSYRIDYSRVDSGAFTDDTRGYFVAKQASSTGLAVRSVPGRRTLRTFTVRPRHYDGSVSAWRPWTRKAVVLQRATSAGWEYGRTVTTNRHGVARVHLRTSPGQRWRAVSAAAATVWGSSSSTRTVHRAPAPAS